MEQRPYQIDCIRETVNTLNGNNDVIIDLPTGTGKTFVYAPIAVEAAVNGYRTCVLCATKDMQSKILNDFRCFPEGDQARTVYGVNMYYCPKMKRSADNWTCKDLRETCVTENIGCDVLKSEETYNLNPLIVTNYSKFLKFRSVPWSLIVIDDSHSFEKTKEDAYQRSVHFYLSYRVADQYNDDPVLSGFLDTFLETFAEVFETSLPPDKKQGALGSAYVKQIGQIVNESRGEKIKQRITNLPDNDKKIFMDNLMFIDACQRSANYNFYVRKDWYGPEEIMMFEMIAREAEDMQNFKIKKCFENARVVLATATPGEPQSHAAHCTNRDYNRLGLEIVPHEKPDIVIN